MLSKVWCTWLEGESKNLAGTCWVLMSVITLWEPNRAKCYSGALCRTLADRANPVASFQLRWINSCIDFKQKGLAENLWSLCLTILPKAGRRIHYKRWSALWSRVKSRTNGLLRSVSVFGELSLSVWIWEGYGKRFQVGALVSIWRKSSMRVCRLQSFAFDISDPDVSRRKTHVMSTGRSVKYLNQLRKGWKKKNICYYGNEL